MSDIFHTLRSVFGYSSFRGHQETVIRHILAGGDALVLMPTGAGKSLCFQIPALLRPGLTVVISPLIALMQDQVDALLQLGINAAYLNSSLNWQEASSIERRALAGDLKLLYVAPERLGTARFMDLLQQIDAVQGLALFAIDEAHCLSQWGHDFRPEYLQLAKLHEQFAHIPRLALTATADLPTREEIIRHLNLAVDQVFVASFDRPNLQYSVLEKTQPRAQLKEFLRAHRRESGIIYCQSRKKVDELAAWLNDEGYEALPYHAGMSTQDRARHQRQFISADSLIMVATIAFGMGIDKPDVRFVVHMDIPKSLEAYYQETGRAGRDGDPADVCMFYGLQDAVLQRQRIDASTADLTQKLLEKRKLDALLAFCESAECRRIQLLRYFGESIGPCGRCDICLNPPLRWDGTTAAQKALSCIYRSGQRFGSGHIIDILRGQRTAQVINYEHHKLSTFGIGQDLDEQGWRAVIRQLLALGYLAAQAERHGALMLTEAARPVLRGEQNLLFRRQRVTKSRALYDTSSAVKAPHSDQLAQALRTWRKQQAEHLNVPPYTLLHDRSLRELATQRPKRLEELLRIHGIGQRKAERYGQQILEIIATCTSG